jgi:succinate dehydrogenase / fumarate reductase iron-sulfur subunit
MEIPFLLTFRAKAFPVIKDLDRSAFDRIQQAGGFVSINTSGNPTDANAIPILNTMLIEL